MDWSPLLVTLRLAVVTTMILVLLGIPLAYWLAHSRSRFKFLVDALVSMPLVLPPSVLGFYLLVTLSPNAPIGGFLEKVFAWRAVFTFSGMVLGSVIFSLPFFVHPVRAGFENIPVSLKEAAYSLGKSPLDTALHVLLPNIKPALVAGTVLAFAHTVGEFGVILMIGGNIPGVTRVASIAIFDEVEAMNYHGAHLYAAVLSALTFFALIVVNFYNKRYLKPLL